MDFDASVKAANRRRKPSSALEAISLKRLVPDRRNANRGTERGSELLRSSLKRLGAGRSILLDRKNRIIAGNKTAESFGSLDQDDVIVVESDGKKLIAVRRTDLDLEDDAEAKELAIADNRVGELSLDWDPEALKALGEDMDLSGLFSEDELAAIMGGQGSGVEVFHNSSLAERFGVPPFSILDARQGYWQDRKRAWLSIGIESELGRGENALGFSEVCNSGGYAAKKRKADARTFGQDLMRGEGNGMKRQSAANSKSETRAVTTAQWVNDKGISGAAGSLTGTSIFDPVLCELAYRWFSPIGGQVLDPFAGGSVRGIVASVIGLKYLGIDLRAEQVAANQHQAARICKSPKPKWGVGDSAGLAGLVPRDFSADLIFSCPPYADLERYSDSAADLSTMDYPVFLEAYRAIIAAAVSKLKPNRFACFVVGDIRDKKGFYRNFPADTIAAFRDAGMELYNEAILITAIGSLSIRVAKQFVGGRKLGKAHQNVLVFFKGDPKKIRDDFPADAEFGEITEDATDQSLALDTSPV